MSSLDWCVCTHIRFWHVEGKCLSCGKTSIIKDAPPCDFKLKVT